MSVAAPPRAYRHFLLRSPEASFWQLAAATALYAQNPHRAYSALKLQYVATCPDASPARYEAAMGKLARICGV